MTTILQILTSILAGRTDPILSTFRLMALRSLDELIDRASVIVVDTHEQDPFGNIKISRSEEWRANPESL